MPVIVQAALLLTASNVFMTFAWYAPQGFGWNYLWASLCICGAVYFTFRA